MAVVAAIPVAAFAQEIASPPAGQLLTGPYDPVSGGNFQFVNDLVGGNFFYSRGFVGESTIIGNVEAGFVWGATRYSTALASALPLPSSGKYPPNPA